MDKLHILKEVLEKNKECFWIVLKSHHPLLFNEINDLSGKNFSEKVYKFLNNNIIPKCECCGGNSSFLSLYKGYLKYCSNKCRGKTQTQNAQKTLNCVFCGKEFSKLNSRKNITCSIECAKNHSASKSVRDVCVIKQKETVLQKYGVDHFSKTKMFSEKLKNTKLIRYDDENYVNFVKAKETKLIKYGNANFNNREKSNKTCLKKYNVDSVSKIPEVRKKAETTMMLKYGIHCGLCLLMQLFI